MIYEQDVSDFAYLKEKFSLQKLGSSGLRAEKSELYMAVSTEYFVRNRGEPVMFDGGPVVLAIIRQGRNFTTLVGTQDIYEPLDVLEASSTRRAKEILGPRGGAVGVALNGYECVYFFLHPEPPVTTRIIPEDLASSIVYTPSAKTGPRFFVPESRYRELEPVLRRIKVKYPHLVVVAGVELMGRDGAMFGPEDDVPVEEEIVEKLGVTVPGSGTMASQARVPADDGRLAPTTPGTTHQPDLSRPTGRGRPPKYPFRNMTHVGDHFLAVGATRPKMQATGCNFLTKSGLRDVVEFSYIRVARGVLVVVSRTLDGRSRYEADGVGEQEDE